MHGMMSSSGSSWPVWVCNHRSQPGASFITVICMRLFIFVAVRHRFQCFAALVSVYDSTHCWPVWSLHQSKCAWNGAATQIRPQQSWCAQDLECIETHRLVLHAVSTRATVPRATVLCRSDRVQRGHHGRGQGQVFRFFFWEDKKYFRNHIVWLGDVFTHRTGTAQWRPEPGISSLLGISSQGMLTIIGVVLRHVCSKNRQVLSLVESTCVKRKKRFR